MHVPCLSRDIYKAISPNLTAKHAYGQVYDITDRDTLERVRHWVKELRTVVRNKTLSVQLRAHIYLWCCLIEYKQQPVSKELS